MSDIHSETALQTFGVVTPATRRVAKAINYSEQYGVERWGPSLSAIRDAILEERQAREELEDLDDEERYRSDCRDRTGR